MDVPDLLSFNGERPCAGINRHEVEDEHDKNRNGSAHNSDKRPWRCSICWTLKNASDADS
jgi:hypothetical protein